MLPAVSFCETVRRLISNGYAPKIRQQDGPRLLMECSIPGLIDSHSDLGALLNVASLHYSAIGPLVLTWRTIALAGFHAARQQPGHFQHKFGIA